MTLSAYPSTDPVAGYSPGPGWGYFDDATHTTTNREAYTAGTRYLLTIDGAGSNTDTTQLNTLPSSVWGSNAISPSAVGEAYSTRLGAVLAPTTNSSGYADVELDIGVPGVSSIVIMSRRFSLDRGNGVEHALSAGFPIFCLATFNANGGRFYMNPSIDCEIWDKDIFLQRTYSP